MLGYFALSNEYKVIFQAIIVLLRKLKIDLYFIKSTMCTIFIYIVYIYFYAFRDNITRVS